LKNPLEIGSSLAGRNEAATPEGVDLKGYLKPDTIKSD
jgi:hypothetical protein